MNTKRFVLGWLVLLNCLAGFAQTVPPIPSAFFQFLQPGYFSDEFSFPTSLTNISAITCTAPPFEGNVLILDTTNQVPAYLSYYMIDTNWNANLETDVGEELMMVQGNWSSVSQAGTGPGATGFLFYCGDTNNGLFALAVDAPGSNMVFYGVSGGITNTYLTAPISWTSNSWHLVVLEYNVGRHAGSSLYLDGVLAGTGGAVSIQPPLNTNTSGFYTNSWFLGSDSAGLEQFRGAVFNLDTWCEITFNGFGTDTNGWLTISNALATWQASLGGGFGGMMGMGLLSSGCPCTNCIFGTNLASVYVANVGATNDTNGDGGITYTFSIQGGLPEVPYDVFSAPSLTGTALTSASWVWLGQGTNCGVYQVTNQPFGLSFYILGTPLPAADGSGLTQAYEALVHSSSSGGDGISGLYKLLHGLSLSTSIAVPALSSISIPTCPVQ
jgi:hypothetical protein